MFCRVRPLLLHEIDSSGTDGAVSYPLSTETPGRGIVLTNNGIQALVF